MGQPLLRVRSRRDSRQEVLHRKGISVWIGFLWKRLELVEQAREAPGFFQSPVPEYLANERQVLRADIVHSLLGNSGQSYKMRPI